MIEFLIFGNVSVALLTLIIVALLGAILYWCVSSMLNFMLNAEHENAKVKIDGMKGFTLFNKLPVKFSNMTVVESEHWHGKWIIKSYITGRILDKRDRGFWASEYATSSFDSKEEAEDYVKNNMEGLQVAVTLFYYLVLAVGVDIVIWLFPMAPTLISTILIIGCVVFGVRKLSGFLWSNMSKTDNIEGRVSKLEGNSNEG